MAFFIYRLVPSALIPSSVSPTELSIIYLVTRITSEELNFGLFK